MRLDTIWRDTPKPFLDHLEELRRLLLGGVAILAFGMLLAIPLAPRIFAWLSAPLEQACGGVEFPLRSLEVAGGFSVALRIAFGAGLLFGSPAFLFLAARFVFPGLFARERRMVILAAAGMAGLFLIGVMLGYFMALPVALKVMLRIHVWMGIRPEWTAGGYARFALQLLLAFGMTFEFPLLVAGCGRLGLVSAKQLRRYRRHAIMAILVAAMLLTPADVFSQLLMALPLIVFYEGSILVVRAFERRRQPRKPSPPAGAPPA